MMDFCSHAISGPLFVITFTGRLQALRVSPAETWLTVYCRRLIWTGKIAELEVIFTILFFLWRGEIILAIISFRT